MVTEFYCCLTFLNAFKCTLFFQSVFGILVQTELDQEAKIHQPGNQSNTYIQSLSLKVFHTIFAISQLTAQLKEWSDSSQRQPFW